MASPSHRRDPFSAGLIALVVTATLPAIGAACPLNSLFCRGARLDSTEPARSTQCCNADFCGTADYDLARGGLNATMSSSEYGGPTGDARVVASDEYVVLGMPSGTPVTIQAEFQLTGYYTNQTACCDGDASGSILEGATNRAASSFSGGAVGENSFDRTLSITVAAVAGASFVLRLEVRAHGTEGANAEITGQLRFSGLPAGTSLTSCQGFRQDGPTPTIPSSWGSLKIRYR